MGGEIELRTSNAGVNALNHLIQNSCPNNKVTMLYACKKSIEGNQLNELHGSIIIINEDNLLLSTFARLLISVCSQQFLLLLVYDSLFIVVGETIHTWHFHFIFSTNNTILPFVLLV